MSTGPSPAVPSSRGICTGTCSDPLVLPLLPPQGPCTEPCQETAPALPERAVASASAPAPEPASGGEERNCPEFPHFSPVFPVFPSRDLGAGRDTALPAVPSRRLRLPRAGAVSAAARVPRRSPGDTRHPSPARLQPVPGPAAPSYRPTARPGRSEAAAAAAAAAGNRPKRGPAARVGIWLLWRRRRMAAAGNTRLIEASALRSGAAWRLPWTTTTGGHPWERARWGDTNGNYKT